MDETVRDMILKNPDVARVAWELREQGILHMYNAWDLAVATSILTADELDVGQMVRMGKWDEGEDGKRLFSWYVDKFGDFPE